MNEQMISNLRLAVIHKVYGWVRKQHTRSSKVQNNFMSCHVLDFK